ncbi:MAG: cellulase family glycosylhydrolase [Mesorhizobium sp.]|nr:cellulase family glycosylhydrolase [Mesorhizobium sp.]MBL8580086.1 cellulase family glycosylhydrolase [Mesorhizobium sp.]
MWRVLLAVAGLGLFATRAVSAPGTPEACAVAERFANPALLATMRRGVNLPGWDNDDAARRPTVQQLEALRDRGFTHVRLLLDGARLEGPRRAAYLDQMYEQAILLFSLDYTVSLDLHAGDILNRQASPEAYLTELWQQIAKRVRFLDPAKLAVELLNEPQADQATWWPLAGRLVAEIRTILPSHSIVVGPAGPQRHEELAGLQPFPDPNVIYAVHYYDPFVFTHQGADWGGPDDPLRFLGGLPFPAQASDQAITARLAELEATGQIRAADAVKLSLDKPWDDAMISSAFDVMAGWSGRWQRPVIVNEFGVLSWRAPRQSRLDWLADVRRNAEERCIGWTHWDFQDGFGLMDPDTGMPDEGVMDALIPKK